MAMQRAGKPVNVGNHIPYIICLAPAQQQAALAAKNEQDTAALAAMDVVDGIIVDIKTDGTTVKHDGEGMYTNAPIQYTVYILYSIAHLALYCAIPFQLLSCQLSEQ
jgi:hypothetical protein